MSVGNARALLWLTPSVAALGHSRCNAKAPNLGKWQSMATKKRTTHRSTGDTKLYAKRGNAGEFEDVQTYRRAHGQDVKRVSKTETAARTKTGQPARKAAKK